MPPLYQENERMGGDLYIEKIQKLVIICKPVDEWIL
jgi:hypothetical protein